MRSITKTIIQITCFLLIVVKLNAQSLPESSLSKQAELHSDSGNYPQAILIYSQAIALNVENGSEIEVANNYVGIGGVYLDLSNYPLAFDFYNKALFIYESLEDSTGIVRCLNNIGIVFKNQLNYKKALSTYLQALDIANAANNEQAILHLKLNIGIVHKRMKDWEKSLQYLNEALVLSKDLEEKGKQATCLNNIGDIYLDLEEFKNARTYYLQAKNINEVEGNQLSLCNSFLGIAYSYAGEENYPEAIKNISYSLAISEDLQLINFESDAQFLLFEIYKTTGDYKNALNSHLRYKILEDSLFNQESIEKIAQIESEYKYKQELEEASSRELTLTKTVKSTSEDLIKSQRNYLIAIIGILLLSLASGGFIFFLKLQQVRAENKNIVNQQKLLRLQMTPHFIFNSLSILQGLILKKEGDKSITYLSKFSKLLRIILENSRHKTVSLSSELEAINSYMILQNLEMNPPYNYVLKKDPTIETMDFKIPPMIIQPFIENIVEHAFLGNEVNKEIMVQFSFKNEMLECTISDNGIGIEMNTSELQKSKKSLATTITSERLELLATGFNAPGSISVVNRKTLGEQGTLVTLIIPYKIN